MSLVSIDPKSLPGVVGGKTTEPADAPKALPDPVAGETYTIRKGDTLNQLAMRVYGDPSKARELAKLNNIQDPNRILAGKTLNLPTAAQMREMSSYDAGRTKGTRVNLTGAPGPSPAAAAAAPAAAAAVAPADSIDIAELAVKTKEELSPTINKDKPPELYKQIDEFGTTNGKLELPEAMAFELELKEKFNNTKSPEERQKLQIDLTTVAGLIKTLRENLDATLLPSFANRIDSELKYDNTNKEIGNKDGYLSRSEVEAFIKDRSARKETGEAAINNARFMKMANELLKRMPPKPT